MTYKGIVKGKTIELEESLPYPEGQPVTVSIQPLSKSAQLGFPLAIREAIHESPHLRPEDVDELERVIEDGKLPVKPGGVFDTRR